MNISDAAQDHEAKEWEERNRPRGGQVKYEPDHPLYGLKYCVDCGNDVHPVRRSYGFSTCIGCASLREPPVRGRG